MILLTDEQQRFADHPRGAFVEACPGAGKTRAIVARIARLATLLPARRGIAVLSFTNSAIEEFTSRCHDLNLGHVLRHPGFVGTFDSFLRRFFFASGGIDGVEVEPIVVDSWKTLDVDVRLRGSKAFSGQGVKLDFFDPESNKIDPGALEHNAALRKHVEQYQADYEREAARRRSALRHRGYISVADVRVEVLQRLKRPEWATAHRRTLGARFHEIIVDEAQDCNPQDCEIIQWLREGGIVVSVVADPNQAIYGFRHGRPAELRAIAAKYSEQDRLSFTSNFRSSRSICTFAATLRENSTPDRAVGPTAMTPDPVHIFAYEGNAVPSIIGRWFCKRMDSVGIRWSDGIVLAHKRKNARQACGSSVDEDEGDTKTARVARAVGLFWLPSASGRARESALQSIERVILELMGKMGDHELASVAVRNEGVDPRWLRRIAIELVGRLPRSCSDTNEARSAWISSLQREVERLGLTYGPGISVRRHFPNRPDATWNRFLFSGTASEIRSGTVHESKGKEYEAICMIIPPDRGGLRRTASLFECWERCEDDEAKRVLYVAITRAKKLAAIAIPSALKSRLLSIVKEIQPFVQVHDERGQGTPTSEWGPLFASIS